MSSFSVVLAEQASSERVASSWRVVVAVAWGSGGFWLAVIWSSTTGISNKSRLAALALISFGVVLTIEAVSVLLVALAGMSVALALLAKSEVEASSGAGVSWSTVFAGSSDVSWWADALLDFSGSESLTVRLGELEVDGDEGRVGAIVVVAGLDEKSVEIGQGHEKMLSGGLLTVDTLPAEG